jgi:hypothetical protein
MKRGTRIQTDPAKTQERAERRAQRRASEPPRPEDLNREKRRAAGEAAHVPRAQLERKPTVAQRRRPISEASPEQRAAVANRACVVCRVSPCDPAHLIPKGLCADGDGDPLAVVPLCRGADGHHRAYDDGDLDLLPFLEPHFRTELAFAVERFGLISTLRRVTNERQNK